MDIHVKYKIIQFIENNIRKAQSMNDEEINWNLLNFKTFALQKILLRELEDKPNSKKVFGENTYDKELYPRYKRNSLNSTVGDKKAITKWARDLGRHFSRDVPMANKHKKRYSTSSVIKELHI